MSVAWSPDELDLLEEAGELEIAVRRSDGSLRAWVPIWIVRVDGHVYVRTWHRRDTGWFGRALKTRRAAVRVPGLEADVRVEDVGASSTGIVAAVDAAYRAKYGETGAASMVAPEAVDATLRLDRE